MTIAQNPAVDSTRFLLNVFIMLCKMRGLVEVVVISEVVVEVRDVVEVA
jgi:hypothetical protein